MVTGRSAITPSVHCAASAELPQAAAKTAIATTRKPHKNARPNCIPTPPEAFAPATGIPIQIAIFS